MDKDMTRFSAKRHDGQWVVWDSEKSKPYATFGRTERAHYQAVATATIANARLKRDEGVGDWPRASY